MKSVKRSLSVLGVSGLVVLFCLVFVMQAAAESTVIIEPSTVLKQHKNTKVTIMGSGFKSGQEIRLLITQSDGSISDIGDGLKPEPVANKDGVWATAWTVGRFGHRRIAKPGVYVLKACDADYNVLATVPFGYYNTKKPYKEWPSWAQAVVKEPKKKKK